MNNQRSFFKAHLALLASFLLILSGCKQMSEKETDAAAGLNGGFEVTKNGLPVNWALYTPKTVRDADFKIDLDKQHVKEGKQSLRFKVAQCATIGGRKSPGFTNEFFEYGRFEGEGTYKLSFWVKNDGTTFNISGGSVTAFEGDMKTLIESNEQIDEWTLMEFEIDIPKDKWLRMQLNILAPGTFWIDDVRIVRI